MRRQWIYGLVVVCAVVGIALGIRQFSALAGRVDQLALQISALDSRMDGLEATVVNLTNSRTVQPQSWVSPASRIQLGTALNACIQLLGDPDEAFEIHMHSRRDYDEYRDYHWTRFDWKTRYTNLARKYECPEELDHQLERMMAGSPVTSHSGNPGNKSKSDFALRWGNVTVFFDSEEVARHTFVEPEATAKP